MPNVSSIEGPPPSVDPHDYAREHCSLPLLHYPPLLLIVISRVLIGNGSSLSRGNRAPAKRRPHDYDPRALLPLSTFIPPTWQDIQVGVYPSPPTFRTLSHTWSPPWSRPVLISLCSPRVSPLSVGVTVDRDCRPAISLFSSSSVSLPPAAGGLAKVGRRSGPPSHGGVA